MIKRILKEGETGTGILIEYDAGAITPELNKDILKENVGERKENQPYLVNCILQKYGVENKNKRVYPESILKRQVEQYQLVIDANSAVGECVTPDHKILTKDGWKFIGDISENEEILTLNRDTNQIEIQKITEKINDYYIGNIYEFRSNNISINATDNHRFLLENRKGEKVVYTAEEIYNNKNNVYSSGKYKIIKKTSWVGNQSNTFELGEYKLPINEFMEFMGFYLSEGSIDHTDRKTHRVTIHQKKEDTVNKIRCLLKKLPFNFRENKSWDGLVKFTIYDKTLKNYLKPLGNVYDKYIPNELKQYSPESLSYLFNSFMLGDGRNVKTKSKNNKKSVFSTSKQLIEDLHEVLVKIGGSGNITIQNNHLTDSIIKDKKRLILEDGTEEYYYQEQLIKGKNKKPLYNLNISHSNHIWLDDRCVKIEKKTYEGYINCVKVPNETWMVQHNGKSHWTLNSDHPSTSVISLDNIAHKVNKMWWGTGDESHILFGTIELINSPAYLTQGIVTMVGDKIVEYLRRGIRLGISSRGVGSVKEVKGQNLVQDDFELICFDLVSSPSTPNAYLFPYEEAMNMKESVERKEILSDTDQKLNNSLHKFLE